jgi:hypothetical protein
MSMWFLMIKTIRIGTRQGNLLVWILSSCCLDHDDVTWDSSKGESFGEQGKERKRWDTKF